jgi:maltose alpha-D-glucosyltransferase/alpha-amylase
VATTSATTTASIPRWGAWAIFADLARGAQERGIRIILDLVVNHTSDEHPWFVSARSSPDSPFRDWYVWSAEEPPNRRQGTVFPGEQTETWTFDEQAQAWYFHRFYDFSRTSIGPIPPYARRWRRS